MVLSPGHRKQVVKALDLLARKDPTSVRTHAIRPSQIHYSRLPRGIEHNFEGMGFVYRGEPNYPAHAFNSLGWKYIDDLDWDNSKSVEDWIDIVGTVRQTAKNRVQRKDERHDWYHHDENGPDPRRFEWAVRYNFKSKRYKVYSKAFKLPHEMTKEQILQHLDDKRLVDVVIPQAGIRKNVRHASINQTARAVKQAHADLTKRQNHLANLLRAVGARRERARRGYAVLQHDQFRPGSSAFHAASKRFHADPAAGQPAKRQKQ
jgi:hypothetical protein